MNLILPEEAVVVTGKVDTENFVAKIFADVFFSAENYSPEFYLIVTTQFENPATYDKLGEIFKNHDGNCKIFLNQHGKWRKLFNQKISLSALVDLKNLLGAENVKLY